MSTAESSTAESQAKLHAVLDERLNRTFQELGFGRAGLDREGGGKVSAFDVVESYRKRTAESAGKETSADALANFLKANEVPIEKAVEIGILWGARYGVTEPQKDFDLNVRAHAESTFNIKATPRTPPTPSADFSITIRPR